MKYKTKKHDAPTYNHIVREKLSVDLNILKNKVIIETGNLGLQRGDKTS